MKGNDSGARSSFLTNVVLIFASIVVSTAVAEGIVRVLDGRPLFAFPLPEPIGTASIRPEQLDAVPLASGVDRSWFFSDPPPLPNRRKPPDDWVRLYRHLEQNPSGHPEFQPSDPFKAWNAAFAGEPCKHRLLRHAPGQLWLYQPTDGLPAPTYRFLPDVTLPDGLVTNQIGWRGKPVETPRPARTVRIVFVGSSTTVGAHHYPFSFPEFVGHFLDRWAAAKRLDVRFEVLNAARESNVSTDIAAVVRNEVLPLQPDLVVYYEGGNQFRPASIVDKMPEGSAARPPSAAAATAPPWLAAASRWSALLGRVQAAVGLAGSDLDGREWPKPEYRVVWPAGLDEKDPDLAYPDLPVSLNVILHDLDRIRADLATIGGELAISSFFWMVKDGLVLDPIRHRYILEQLNIGNYPFRYRELERLAAFQNRVLAKYAKVHGLTFIDYAAVTPFDPDLYVDAVHPSYAGVRLHGWIVFQQLVPLVEKHLKDGTWPKPPRPDKPLPVFQPKLVKFDCRSVG